MDMPDLNLLITLDVLLAEGNVARAARRLGLSPSAMSRQLARLRETTGDPLLVRAGRGLTPTPRALALRAHVGELVQQAAAALRPAEQLDLARLERIFTLRVSDGFVENFGPALVAQAALEAPGVRLYFVQKQERDNAPLRDGSVDLETGVVGKGTGADLHAQALFRDRFIGVARAGHPLVRRKVTTARYAACRHIALTRGGQLHGPVDEALAALRLERGVATAVSGFAAALALARGSDLVATVPERHTSNLREGMASFALPFDTPAITISMLWHPRLHADPAHRWLRARVREVCKTNGHTAACETYTIINPDHT